jgi:hypothetical protein
LQHCCYLISLLHVAVICWHHQYPYCQITLMYGLP